MIYLALRHTKPSGFFARIFSSITCTRLVTRYPHSGIVIDDMLYESNFRTGVHCSKFKLNSEEWSLFRISDSDEEKLKKTMLRRFDAVKYSKYDWFALFAFILPFRFALPKSMQINVAKQFYCHEFTSYMIDGIWPTDRITPEILLVKLRAK